MFVALWKFSLILFSLESTFSSIGACMRSIYAALSCPSNVLYISSLMLKLTLALLLSLCLRSLSFMVNLYIGLPPISWLHVSLSMLWNSYCFVQCEKNLNGDLSFSIVDIVRIDGEWSDIPCGRNSASKIGKIEIQSSFTRTLSSFAQILLLPMLELDQVKRHPLCLRSISLHCWRHSSKQFVCFALTGSPLIFSVDNKALLKSPDTVHAPLILPAYQEVLSIIVPFPSES